MKYLIRLLNLFRPFIIDCRYCNVAHYNECTEARLAMEMWPGATWECVDGTHNEIQTSL